MSPQHAGERSSAEGGRFNLARYFVEHRQVAWALLVAMLVWGAAGYQKMAKRKDPEIPVRVALAACPWPGMSAARVEELVTRKLERALAGNSKIDRIESTTRDGVAIVLVFLSENVRDTVEQFADIGQRVGRINDLPPGAGPVTWMSDFGDTAALMLTVASPKVGPAELRIRGIAIRQALVSARAGKDPQGRVTALYCLPADAASAGLERVSALFSSQLQADGLASDVRALSAGGCEGLDFETRATDGQLRAAAAEFVRDRLGAPSVHPDAWGPIFVRDPAEAPARLAEVAGDLYTYRQLDDFTDQLERVLQNVPAVSKVSRTGVVGERIFVEYAQERLAAAKLLPARLGLALAARNTAAPAGVFDTGERHAVIDPNLRAEGFRALEDLIVGASAKGTPARLRDLATLSRGYESPPRLLNYLVSKDRAGQWQRSRAITLAVQMRSGEQIASFGAAVEKALTRVRRELPPELIIARTSDQPRQVGENVSLFMVSLYEAIALVVVVSLVGFWSWRSALLVAASIPLTLAISFGAMQLFGVDIQQVSIATLIIALGLLVDMPVVAGDAIERELAAGRSRELAAWLGPTRLLRAILFATITNVVAYLPFLLLSGNVGDFLHSLPVVMTLTLVAALGVSVSFIPLLAFGLVKAPAKAERPLEERRHSGVTGWYANLIAAALRRRFLVLALSLLVLAGGGALLSRLKTQFFPTDLSYLSYVEVWLPEDAPLAATNAVAAEAERVIREQAEAFGKAHGHPGVLRTLTTFVGGGGPRFWFSVTPEQQQLNYAQLLVEVNDKHLTPQLVAPLQAALSRIPGARIDVRQLETGKPVGIPVSIRLSGEQLPTLRRLAAEVAQVLREVPIAARVRDNWGAQALSLKVDVDDDRAGLSGVTRLDVARSSAAAVSGLPLGTWREGDKQLPVVARLRLEDRGRLSDLDNVYVFSAAEPHSVPLRQVATIAPELVPAKLQRRNQIRTVTVSAFPASGALASEVLQAARPRLEALERRLPTGYRMEIAGEQEEQDKGFAELALVMAASVALIYFALVFQFDSAVKPLIVFAAIPYGMAGAIGMLALMGLPFGFMAFLGIASLVGVIVSHIIVLFDFIEEARERGRPLEEALIEAGIVRLRPVLITVGATVLGLVPLALHGGPLWEPLCYAQIGGLTLATGITLVLVPLLYTVFVRDLRLVRWEAAAEVTPPPHGGPTT
jgi:multidrug efflux pump subunit AcrB